MRICLSICLMVLLALSAGCNQANKSTTTSSTTGKNTTGTTSTKTTDETRTTVSKPALGGGETGVAGDSSTAGTSSTDSTNSSNNNSTSSNQPPRADNTKVNQRDRNADEVLPTDQGNNQADIDRTSEIRKRIVDLKNISVNGRNVKVITKDGKVTLRGPVASDDERQLIEKIAKDVAGSDNVNSGLEVAP